DSVNAAVGGSVTFTTSQTPTETPLHFISWNKGTANFLTSLAGGILINPEYKDRVTLNVLTGSLELRNLAVSDAGEYSVTIRTIAGDESTGQATLNVYEPVSNVRITTNNTDLVEFKDTVRLSCSASGSSLSFLWFNDSVEVTASDRVRITDGGATLTIVTVLRYDQGSYTCEVSNPVNSSTSDEELFVSYGPEGVRMTISPSAEYYGEGSVVSFSCSADSRPEAQFRWFINGEMLSSTGAQIKLVMEQSGNYSCQAFNSKTLRYTTSQPEEILLLSKNTSVEGGSVNLTCDASGSIFTRQWMINGVELKPSENIVFYEEKKVLLFRVLTRKDSGRYTCNISNPFSSDFADHEMNVNYGPAPGSVQISGPRDVLEGSTLKLNCSAESVPTAKYTWTKDGTTLGQSHEYTKDNIKLSDSGEYICRATNDVTLKSLEASHTVNVTEMISDALVSSSTQLPEEGTSLNVTCDASGSVSTREWMKNGSPLNSSQNIMFYHQNQVLSFRSLSRKDSGRYSCNISNPVSSQEDTYYMVVTYGPENIEMSGSKEVQVQTAFRLSCSAESVPAASYIWIKNGTTVADSFEFTKNMSEFSDSGEYICRATNDITMKTSEASHMVLITEPVTNVRITTNNTDLVEFNDTVRLSCSASGSSLSFLWFNDSVEVTASDRVRITDGGATLTIVTVLRYDQGSYTCEVSNLVSSNSIRLTISPSAEYYGEGSVVSFSCSADSRPEAQFRWFINGEMSSSTGAQINLFFSSTEIITNISFTSSSKVPVEGTSVNLTCDASGSIFTRKWMISGVELKPSENIVFHEEKRVLSFRNLTRKDDGRYTCRISNPVSSQSKMPLMVHYVSDGPDSVQISGPMEVQEGSTLKLSCSAESVPTAKYTWTKDGTTLGQSHEYTKDNIKFSDGGEYICQATNDITMKSSEASRTVYVTGINFPQTFIHRAGVLLLCVL
uniref:Ig-like domain-containing protein n=1 Tax=Neogobius melanostomus TaxID=47308 RepID=A0A8C6SKS4_9GOBI